VPVEFIMRSRQIHYETKHKHFRKKSLWEKKIVVHNDFYRFIGRFHYERCRS